MTGPPPVDLVVGADIGGTSTRVGVADLDGTIVALASGGPGNPNSVGVDGSAAEIRAVTERALEGLSGRVVAVVVGLAGGSRAATVPGFLRAAVPEGVDAPAQLVGDVTVAFCSATADHSGYVIVAGTGAIAGEVSGTELVRQRDGWGWLLGDDGSGFWMGRAAVRATLDGLQRHAPPGPLQRAVLVAAGVSGPGSAGPSGEDPYLALLQASYAQPPTWLAQFSRLVSEHAAEDPVAAVIADDAAGLLERLLFSLGPEPGRPIVLGGSVLTQPGPVSQAFRERLDRRLDSPVLTSTTGVIGALWIGLGPHVRSPTETHRRLVITAQRWL